MRIVSKPYGPIEVDERQQILFPFGILGFENLKRYVLLDAAQQPFYWLQSAEVAEIAFILIDPRVFRPGYLPDVDPEELAPIAPESVEDLLDFAIVTIPEDPMEMTANLQGPVLINRRRRLGRQCISRDLAMQVRHPILKDLAEVRQESC
jgi:flagellar assembly factor FliW